MALPDRTLERLLHDPRRSPRWRYDRIRTLLDSRPDPRLPEWCKDDKSIVEAFEFLRQWDQLGRDYPNPRRLAEMQQGMYAVNPELYLAHDLAFAADSERNRYEIEARILARQTNEQICNEICGLPGMVEWYEKLFFNVRDRINRRGYIANKVILPSVIEPSWENLTLDMTAKFFGYFAGPIVLDVILHGYDSSTVIPQKGDDTGAFFDQHWNTQFRRRSAEAVNSFEFNKFNVVELFEVHTKLLDMAQKAKNEIGNLSTIEQNVEVMLGSIQFSSGSRLHNDLAKSPFQPYIGQAGELRASEMMQIASGDVPETVSNITSLKLPERSVTKHEQPVEQGS